MKNKKKLTTCLLIVTAILLTLSQTTSAAASGDLQIIGYNDNPQIYSYTYMESLAKTYVQSDLYCYGLWVTGGNWGGVKLSDLLKSTGVDLSIVGSVQFIASDGYQVKLDAPTALRPDVIVAYEKDDISLTETYRLVYPGANGALWVSMITSITASQIPIEVSQTGNSINPPPIARAPNNYQTITPTPTPTHATTNQPTPTPTPTNNSITQPISPPANTPEPTTNTNIAKENSAFPVEIIYIAAVVAALVAASFVLIRRRIHKA
jgi:hypothetical protein